VLPRVRNALKQRFRPSRPTEEITSRVLLTTAITMEARRLDRCSKASLPDADLQRLVGGLHDLLHDYAELLGDAQFPAASTYGSRVVAA
jgi:hypothetical protein